MVSTTDTFFHFIASVNTCKQKQSQKGGKMLSRRNQVEIPAWAQRVRHSMVDAGISVTDLAQEIGLSRVYVSTVLNGKRISPGVQERIESWHKKNFPTA